MSKLVKEYMTQELRRRYGSLDSAVWVEFIGCDGITTNQFRRSLREKQIRLEVVRNRIFRRAVAEGPLAPLAERMAGPSAILTGGESVVDIAKALEEWLPKIEGLKLKGAVLEGELLDEQTVQRLSKMPTKKELQARIAGCIASPAARVAGAIASGGSRVAACVKTLIEKLEKGETIAATSG